METIQLYNLNSLCRACLSCSENMRSLYESENDNIFNMFVVVANFEVEKSDSLPSYLCNSCAEKLNISYEFRNQCKKTQDLLREYASNDFTVMKVSEPTLCEPENFEDDPVDTQQEENVVKAKPKRKQKLRLQQFPFDQVSRAIEQRKRKFFENRNCIKCNFRGSNSRSLSIHVSHIHKELKDRWCSICNGEVDNVREHLKSHEDDDLKCQFCSKRFTAKGHLTEHLRCHTSVRPFKCDTCDKSFISSRHLKIHYRIHSKEKPYKCKKCTKSFIQYNSLKLHMKQHDKHEAQSGFTCAECKATFKMKVDLVAHMCLHDLDGETRKTECSEDDSEKRNEIDLVAPVRQNFCSACDKKVRSLTLHNEKHHKIGDDTFDSTSDCKLCTVCGKQFKTSSKLAVHMRIHTGDAPYQCSYCSKRLTTRNHLVVHERIHTGERPHVCGVCKKAFSQSSVLNTHMKLHTGRPEVCTICDQRFCRPAELRLHMRRHTGEKPYLCTECGQSFIQRSHLVEHFKIHSDHRPFQCPYCERAFRQSSSLKSHSQIHLGYKPYRCSQCSYACRQSYSLTQHMKQHVNDAPRPDKPHVCLVCQKGYTTFAMLTSHMAAAHGVCEF